MGPKAETTSGGQHVRSKTITAGITPASDVSTTSSLSSIASSIGPQPMAPTLAVPPTYYIQHAPISIHAAKLNTWSFEKIAELDHGKNNWSDWSFAMKLALNQHLISGYLIGTIKAPDTVLEPGMFNNWTLNNIAIVSALCSRVSHEDQQLLEDVTNVKQAWDTLRERHEKVGPIAQILLIQEVFVKCYSRGQRFSLTSRLESPLKRFYLSIAMLNALSGELSAVQTQVVSLLSSSSKDRPFTSADIRACLDTEQQLLDNEKACSADIALAASTHPKYGGHSHGARWWYGRTA
ncbi:hypothetical protein BDN67DRAFT_982250 [Paxillus ammoniavirescens]|nr:hypothetical protein BDN67DRAFT_982250 [Paxillus ammoniavirescens]